MSTRREARELALRALYAHEFNEYPVNQVIKDIFVKDEYNQMVLSFAKELLKSTVKNIPELDQLIKRKALNWDFERIAIIDKLILRLAICEFLYFPDIPPKVSIDEAIEISKKYSTEKSGKFINGILDSLLTELKKASRIKKTGRGLIDSNPRKSELL